MLKSRTVTVRDLRRSNRSRVLWEVFLRGPLTRQEVGALAGLSLATVSNLVAALEAEGVVAEVGLEDSNGGRPRGLLQVNPEYGFVIGVDVGESAFLVELFDFGLGSRARHTSVTDVSVLDPQDAVDHIVAGVSAVTKEAGVSPGAVLGAGVAVPGLVQDGLTPAQDGPGAVVHGQSIGWRAVPLEAMVAERTGLPVLVDNGAKALGQAEWLFGAARGADDAVIVLLGIGAGACIVAGGELYRGAAGSAGEWGHTTAAAGGRSCRCGAAGCLEAYIGAGAVADRYRQLKRRPASASPVELEGQIAQIIAARESDKAAAQVLDETVDYLGAGIADLVNLFNPERVVLGGWLGRALSAALLPQIRAAVRSRALQLPFSRVQIAQAELGADAVALGGATLPIARLIAAGAVAAPDGPGRRLFRPAAAGG
ncbi:MAG TPA: ROK family transcriptional regulator [Streptosporangiaceae bacterium]|jgi:predicted NBD/HSP70 family sugar kinase